eukprot:scaffold6342_cov206-Alexandrium_tamarense.AAC.1
MYDTPFKFIPCSTPSVVKLNNRDKSLSYNPGHEVRHGSSTKFEDGDGVSLCLDIDGASIGCK